MKTYAEAYAAGFGAIGGLFKESGKKMTVCTRGGFHHPSVFEMAVNMWRRADEPDHMTISDNLVIVQ